MLSQDILKLPVTEVSKKLRAGEFTSAELTRSLIHYARSINDKTNAYISFREEEALKEAAEADKAIQNGTAKGIYYGIPMGIKDNIYLKGEITTMGSKIHKDFISDMNASVVDILKEAGVIIIGKLNLHEYAWGVTNDNPHFGATHNPWNLSKITGGSSGGNGAAIASAASYASVGTDTAGSVRIPASCCGIVGFKPSQNLIGRDGVFPLSTSLDHVGPMGKTVEDVAALLDLLADKNEYSASLKNEGQDFVVGINEEYFMHNLDNNVEKIIREQIQNLKDQGITVKEVKIPSLEMVPFMAYMTILSESFTIHDDNLKNRIEDFGPDVQGLYSVGIPSAVDYIKARQLSGQLKREFEAIFSEVDVLLTPALPVLPPDIGSPVVHINGKEEDLNDHIMRFMFPGNITGLPALVLPGGMADGLPVGLQIFGPEYGERKVLQFAKAMEKQIAFKPINGLQDI